MPTRGWKTSAARQDWPMTSDVATSRRPRVTSSHPVTNLNDLLIECRRLPVLPIIVSISVLLIADIDSPRIGIIRVLPDNLISLSQSIAPR